MEHEISAVEEIGIVLITSAAFAVGFMRTTTLEHAGVHTLLLTLMCSVLLLILKELIRDTIKCNVLNFNTRFYRYYGSYYKLATKISAQLAHYRFARFVCVPVWLLAIAAFFNVYTNVGVFIVCASTTALIGCIFASVNKITSLEDD